MDTKSYLRNLIENMQSKQEVDEAKKEPVLQSIHDTLHSIRLKVNKDKDMGLDSAAKKEFADIVGKAVAWINKHSDLPGKKL